MTTTLGMTIPITLDTKTSQSSRIAKDNSNMTYRLVYITPCKHHIVLENENLEHVGLISITHISDKGDHYVVNKTYEVTKFSIDSKNMEHHFTFLANFCSLQDNT